MVLVIGVDPGTGGALATVDETGALIDVQDMPHWFMPVGKKKRKRVDAVGLVEYFECAKEVMGVELVVLEAVGGRPKQSASAGFVFGYTMGLIYMACISVRLPIETVPPGTWKKLMNVPGKSRATDDAIEARCFEMFPDYVTELRGPNGGKKIDRCEAAMLGLFGQRHVLNAVGQIDGDSEWRSVYRQADTGA